VEVALGKKKSIRVLLGTRIPILGKVTLRCRAGHVFRLEEAEFLIDAITGKKYVLCPHCHIVAYASKYDYDLDMSDVVKDFAHGLANQQQEEKREDKTQKALADSISDLSSKLSTLIDKIQSLEKRLAELENKVSEQTQLSIEEVEEAQ